MTAFVLAAFLLGLVAGLRAMTAPAIVAWAASLGTLGAIEGWFAFMAWRWTAPLATALAVGEWISDQLPSTPSRKVPVQFVTRLLTGTLSGGTLGAVVGSPFVGICAGVAGSVTEPTRAHGRGQTWREASDAIGLQPFLRMQRPC